MKNIWKINNKEEMISYLLDFLDEKSKNGDHMDKLNEVERVFYIASLIEMEVGSGGFHSLFCGYIGDLYDEFQSVYEEIGAKNMARICRDAVALLKGLIPEGEFDFETAVDIITTKDECYDMFDELDDQVYDYPDDTAELLYKYAIRNKGDFSY